jgi:hypothetical protein
LKRELKESQAKNGEKQSEVTGSETSLNETKETKETAATTTTTTTNPHSKQENT